MHDTDAEALRYAQDFAPEAETILGVTGLQDELAQVSGDETRFHEITSRSLETLGDVASIAAALIALFQWIGQIRQGQILRKATPKEMVADLIARVLDDPNFPADVKERLILAAFEKLAPTRPEEISPDTKGRSL